MVIKDMSDKKGFTLIELVMVIVIIGILAAAALPRFANLTSQARTASNAGVAGAMRSAVMIAHAAWIAAGGNASVSAVTLDGSVVSVNNSGWPDAGAGTTPTAANCVSIMQGILIGAPEVTATTCTGSPCYIATVNAAPNADQCVYTLNGGAVGDAMTYDLSSGDITVP